MKIFKRKYTFFGTLVKNFILYSIVVVSVLLFIFIVGLIVASTRLVELFSPIEINLSYIEKNQYESFPIKTLGKGGEVLVYDLKGNCLYNKGENTFNLENIDLIPYNTEDFNSTLEKEYSSTGEIIKIQNEFESSILLDENLINPRKKINTYIFKKDNENYVLQYSTDSLGKKVFTKKELSILQGKIDDLFISKIKVKTEKGDVYAIFLRNKSNYYNKASYLNLFFRVMYYIFLIILFGSIILMFIYINNKVKKPFKLLNNAITQFALGEYKEPIKYKGPIEFEDICDNFNEMAIKLNIADKKRKYAEDARKKMLSDISHDIKTPITVIQGFAQAIKDKMVNEDELDDYLSAIYNNCVNITELVTALSLYNKMDHPDFILDAERENINNFVREYFINKYREIEFQDFKLDLDIPETKTYCNIQKFEFKRLFDNIISNIIKYNGEGTKIICYVKEDEDDVVINLGDNGIGIPKNLAKSIFHPFTVGDKSRSTSQGSGLGMAIVKKIVEAHNGSIELIENPEFPFVTQFKIKIPKFK